MHVRVRPHHVSRHEEVDVLDGDEEDRRECIDERDHRRVDPFLLAQRVVVERVRRNGLHNIVHEEQRHIREERDEDLRRIKRLYGKEPDAEVRLEEVVCKEHAAIGDRNNDHRQQQGLAELLQVDLHAVIRKAHLVFLAVEHIGQEHRQNAEHTAGRCPDGDTPRGALCCHTLCERERANVEHDRQIDQRCKHSAQADRTPEPQLAARRERAGFHGCFGAKAGEERREHHQDSKVHDEHHKPDQADQVEGFFPLPNLIVGIDGVRRAKCFAEEVDRRRRGLFGEVRPRMDDGGVVDHAHRIDAIDGLVIHRAGGTRVFAGRVNAEIQEGLRIDRLQEVSGRGHCAVCIRERMEEFIILAGDHARITVAVDVDKCLRGGVVIGRIRAVEQNGGDQMRRCRVVLRNSGVAGHAAERVPGDADAGCIHIAQGGEHLDRFIHACQHGADFRDVLGIAVREHIHRKNDEAAAGQFHKVGILHFAVVKHTMTYDDGRNRMFRRNALGHEQQSAHLDADRRFPAEVFDRHFSASRLHRGHNDHAEQHQCDCDAEPNLCSFLSLFHVFSPLFLCSFPEMVTVRWFEDVPPSASSFNQSGYDSQNHFVSSNSSSSGSLH